MTVLWVVEMRQTHLGQQMRNVLTYASSSSVASQGEAGALAAHTESVLAVEMAKVQRAVLLHTGCYVFSPFDPAAFDDLTYSTPVPGLRTGQNEPPFVAWSFRQNRGRRDIASGFKRVGGVSETDTVDGVAGAAMIPVLDAFAVVLSSSISLPGAPGSPTLTPVVVKRIKYTTPAGKTAYRWPETLAEYLAYAATSWQRGSPNPTTQNSRKLGRGV